MSIQPVIPILWLLGLLGLAAALLFVGARSHWAHLPAHLNRWLAGLRTAGLLGVGLLLLQPYWRDRSPDPDAVEVALLADASGSMAVRDLPGGRTRMEGVQAAFDWTDPRAPVNLLANRLPVRTFAFSDDVRALSAVELPGPAAGSTAIGDALLDLLDRPAASGRRLAGVVLFSDGNETAGDTPMLEAGRRFRERGIPISTVGVGSQLPVGDVAVNFTRPRQTVSAGEPFTQEVRVRNDFNRTVETTVELLEGNRVIDRQRITLDPNSETTVSFEATATVTGMETYSVRLVHDLSEGNPLTDEDFAAVEVEDPERFRILYLGARLHPEFRFIRQALETEERLQLHALIRMSEDSIHWRAPDQPDRRGAIPDPGGFPEDGAFFFQFDAILLDLRAVDELTEAALEGLQDFVANRAGGLFAFGPVPENPLIRALLPVNSSNPFRSREDRFFQLEADPVFNAVAQGLLFQPPGLAAPSHQPGWTGELKRGARALGSFRPEGAGDVLALHTFGGGRAIWFGLDDTWRWRLESDRGFEQHRLFWTESLLWLSSGARPRVRAELQGSRVTADAPVDLDLRLRGRDFRPEREARVVAVLTRPDGSREEVLLQPDAFEVGRFRARAQATGAGVHQVDYRMEFTDGEVLETDVQFFAVPGGAEFLDTSFREAPLRDLARLTGGRYFTLAEAREIVDMPLAEEIPLVTQNVFWTRTWPFFLALAAIFGAEWFTRRRFGLK